MKRRGRKYVKDIILDASSIIWYQFDVMGERSISTPVIWVCSAGRYCSIKASRTWGAALGCERSRNDDPLKL